MAARSGGTRRMALSRGVVDIIDFTHRFVTGVRFRGRNQASMTGGTMRRHKLVFRCREHNRIFPDRRWPSTMSSMCVD